MSAASNIAKLKPDVADVQPPSGLALLREPFPDHLISKLPKETGEQIAERKQNARTYGIKCPLCGSWHHKDAIHLDYVGHAALTHRLLEVDPHWSWEPVAFGPDGLPAFDRSGGLWIRLTICGVSRLGYGNANGKSHQDLGAREKEVIGDALRNAGMRFGAALDLWHKGDLHVAAEEPPGPTALNRAIGHMKSVSIDEALFREAWRTNKDAWSDLLNDADWALLVAAVKAMMANFQAAQPRLAAPPPPPPAPPREARQSDPFDISEDEIPF